MAVNRVKFGDCAEYCGPCLGARGDCRSRRDGNCGSIWVPVGLEIWGYTEVDIELRDPIQINREVFYFWDLRIDAERVPTSTQPLFNAEIEYCPKGFPLNGSCFYDQIGEFRRVVLQR